MNAAIGALPGKVLLIGADGMLGRCWEEFLKLNRVEHHAVGRRRVGDAELDVRDAEKVEHTLAQGYDWAINCTAYTAVDAAESDPDAARQVNDVAVRHLAESSNRHGVALVHYSTDYVFSGEAREPYAVDAPMAPINVYGRTKADGDRHVQHLASKHLLLRTSWVYAPWGKNFVGTMRQLLGTRTEVDVVSDQVGRPTSVHTLVDVTWQLMTRGASGTFHVAEAGPCSWFDFASEIGRQLGSTCVVRPCSTAQFPRPAKRPAYSVLDTSVTEEWVGAMPPWQSALAATLRHVVDV